MLLKNKDVLKSNLLYAVNIASRCRVTVTKIMLSWCGSASAQLIQFIKRPVYLFKALSMFLYSTLSSSIIKQLLKVIFH